VLNSMDFLSRLAETRFGKLVCLNLYRASRIGLLKPADLRAYFEDCTAELNTWSYDASEEFEAIVRASRSWQVRQRSSRQTRRDIDKADVDPTGISTVAHLWSVLGSLTDAANSVYADRRKQDADDFREFVGGLLRGDQSWKFGRSRDYSWMASSLDVSTRIADRAGRPAQLHCDVLGLCHFGSGEVLVRLTIANRGVNAIPRYYRPMAFDGLDNAAFRSTRDGESAASLETHGTTVDLSKVHARDRDVDGTREWLCEPTEIRAADITWEFLGSPSSTATQGLPSFQDAMFEVLGGQSMLAEAMPLLRSAIGDDDA
jgi:hypothetical protein